MVVQILMIKGDRMKEEVFTREEREFIIENYPKMPTSELIKIIGHTEKQIRGYANGKGLRKHDKPNRFEEWQKKYILKWYNIKTNGEIASKLGLTTKQVNDYGYRNIGKRNIEHYKVNEDYFSTIDTEDKAYWLGFLYADGNVHEDKSRGYVKSINTDLALSYIDVGHLIKFNKSISSNYPIKEKIVKLNDKEYKACRVTICNTNFSRNLIKNKCIPNKSLTLEFPDETILHKSLIRHFVRGYFDGDGCVSHSTEQSKTPHYIYGFVGTLNVINSIQDILNHEINATRVKISEKGNAYQCQWSGRGNCRRFFEYIYKDSTVWLDRKYNKFIKIINNEV